MLPNPVDSITAEELPNDSLFDIAERCGLGAARALIQNCPGLNILIPHNGLFRVQQVAEKRGQPKGPYTVEDMPRHDFKFVAQTAGVNIAISLLEKGAGLHLVVPLNPLRKMARRYIHENWEQGVNDLEVMAALHLTRGEFYLHLNQKHVVRKDPAQTHLFEV